MKTIRPPFDIVMVWYQNDWGLYGRRNECIARALLKHKQIRRVLHIEPPLDLEHLRYRLRSASIDDNVHTNLKRLNVHNDGGVYVYTPHIVRGMSENDIFRSLQQQIIAAMGLCGMSSALLWLYPPHPFSEFMLSILKDRTDFLVTDCVDDHRQYAKTATERDDIDKRYKRIVSASDIVFTVSKAMRDEMAQYNTRTFYIPNAIPVDIIGSKINYVTPECMKNIKHPIIGYTGALSLRIDTDLLAHIAKTKPDWNIVLIGTSPTNHVRALFSLPNVHWTGPIRYCDIHSYMAQFDACILPHTVDSMTDNMNPLKIYEYLALGKPVISTNVAGVAMFGPDIQVANNSHEFIHAIETSLNQKSFLNQEKRMSRVRNHTWTDRVDEMMRLCLSVANSRQLPKSTSNNNGYFNFDRPEVRSCIPKEARVILDIGCGAGRLGAALKKDQKCFVIGVEYDPEIANSAKYLLDDVIVGDIEEKIQNFPTDYFECVVLADVLEHLRDPKTVLSGLKRCLKANGRIVASIPNVRHWSVVAPLLSGSWDYEDAGILDRTHLRFFTKRSIEKLFVEAGYTITDLKHTTVGSNRSSLKPIIQALFPSSIDTSTLAEEANHYQYIVSAEKTKTVSALTSIIVLTLNQLPHTKLCLESIEQHTPEPHELIIVDNGSTDGTLDYLREYVQSHDDVRVISNAENLGFAAGNNQGLSVANGNYLLLLNNDTIVTKGWLNCMLSVFEQYPEVGIVGPVSNNISGPQRVLNASYKNVEDIQSFARKWSAEHRSQSMELFRVVGFCLIAKREVVERIGGLYEEFGSGNFEDDDFCLRAAAAGFKSRIALDAFVHHTGSQTFKGAGIDYQQSLKRNWEIFKKRWQLPEDLPYGPYSINLNGTDCSKYYVELPSSSDVSSRIAIQSQEQGKNDRVVGVSQMVSSEDTSFETDKSFLHPKLKPSTPELTSIIIYLDKNPQHIEECVASVKKYTSVGFEILFALPPGAEKARRAVKNLRRANRKYGCMGFEDNRSLLRSINLAIKDASGEFVVIMDGNVIATEDWLKDMLDCMQLVPSAGMVGPTTNSAPAPQIVDVTNCRLSSEWDVFAKTFRTRNRHRRAVTMKLGKFCLLCRKDVFESIGLLDPSLEDTSLWDVDLCLRAFVSGRQSLIAAEVFLRSYVEQGGNQNSNIFAAKWSNVPSGSDVGKALLVLKSIEYAQGLYGRDKLNEAVKALMQGVRATPDDIRIYHYLARILLSSGAPGEALAALRSIPDGRSNTETLELFAFASAALEQDEDAERYAEELLLINDRNAVALNVKGLLAFKEGNADRAATFFRGSAKSDPGYAEPYRNLGLIEWSLNEKSRSYELLEKAFVLAPESENNANTYYTAVAEMEAWEKAERVISEAKMLYPNNRRIAFLLIDALLKQGKFASALAQIEEVFTTFSVDEGLLVAALEVREKLGPMTISADGKAGTMSVCMITKNEEANIAKCLESLKPVADEIIIVDTGSTDRTKDIARVFGAQVFDYVWTNDFSAARNTSLEKAAGDWILVHDADEVISKLDHEELRTITRKKPSGPVAYSFITRNYTTSISLEGWTANLGEYPEETCAGWFPSRKVRLLPNDARFRFRNPVHELLEPSLLEHGAEIRTCKIPIHHYGRLDTVKTSTKAEIYYELGKTKLMNADDELVALRELALQAGELGKDQEAIDLWQRYIKLDPNLPRAYSSLSHCYLKQDDFDNALASAKKAVALDPLSIDATLQYATASLFSKDSCKAISLMEDLLRHTPSHPYAQIILAVAHILGGHPKGSDLLVETKKLNFDSSQLLSTLAQKLDMAGMADGASRIRTSAIEAGYALPDRSRRLGSYGELFQARA